MRDFLFEISLYKGDLVPVMYVAFVALVVFTIAQIVHKSARREPPTYELSLVGKYCVAGLMISGAVLSLVAFLEVVIHRF